MPRLRVAIALLVTCLVFALSVASVGAEAIFEGAARPAPEQFKPRPAPVSYHMGQLKHSVQTLNNCGPASVVSTFSFYGIDVSQEEARQVLRPYAASRGMSQHVIPPYVAKFGLEAKVRLNGNDDLIKALVANDIPVIVLQYISETWRIGHFRVIQGYDDRAGVFYANDSLLGPNIAISYKSFNARWDYNWKQYIPVYQPEQAPLIAEILGPDWTDEGMNNRMVPALLAKFDPKDTRTWSRLIDALIGAKRYDEALTELDNYDAFRSQQAQQATPSGNGNGNGDDRPFGGNPSSTSTTRIKLLNKLERFEEALALADEAFAKMRTPTTATGNSNGNTSLWLQKAEALRGLKRYDEARAAYLRAIGNDGAMSEANQRLQSLPR